MKVSAYKYVCLTVVFLSTHGFSQQSLSLSDAITAALEKNYDIRISRLDLKTASVMNSWGTAGAFPTLDFSLSATRTQDMDTETYTDRTAGGLSASWVLFDGFSVHIRKSRLNELENLSEGNTALLVEQTVQSVILAYYNALLQQQMFDVTDTLRSLSRDRYDRAESQRQLGSLVTYDVLQAKNAWLEDEGRYLQQQANARNAIRELNYLMGETEDILFQLTDAFAIDKKTYAYPAMLEKLKSDNRMLRNRYIQQTLLEKDVVLTYSDYSPMVTLRGGLDKMRLQGDNMSITDTYQGYGTVSLSWNLFSGGARMRAVQVAKLDREIGKIEIESMMHSLANRLAAQLETYNVRKQLLDVANEALKTAELNLQISKEKFKTGAINSFNYRDVQQLYLNAAVARLHSIYNLIDSETELLRMTGGILSSVKADQ